MKKIIGSMIIIGFIALFAFLYFKIGHKAATEGAIIMHESQSTIDNAKKSMDDLNKSTEDAKKALDQMGGGSGK